MFLVVVHDLRVPELRVQNTKDTLLQILFLHVIACPEAFLHLERGALPFEEHFQIVVGF